MSQLKKNSKSYSLKTKLYKELDGTPRTKVSGREWVLWGQRNDYPDSIAELYYNSITLHSCVDFAVTSILGEGIDYEKMGVDQSETVPSYESTWEQFIKDISLDFVLYGSFAFQIIKNNDGQTYSYYHQPMSTIRCAERDEDGQITKYFICQDWSQVGKYPPVEIKRFGFTEDEKISNKEPYLFVYESYNPSIEYYSIPRFIGALKAAQAEAQMVTYELRSIQNGFSSSGFLILPEVETDEEKQELLSNIQKSFTGAENAGSLVVTFSNGSENENLAKFVKIDKDASNNVNLFQDANDRTIERIVSSFRIPSKSLIGYPSETSSLGGDGNLLNVSYQLYNKTIGNSDREEIVNTINKMFSLNGIDTQLYLKPMSFNIVNDTIVNENRSGNSPDENDLTDGNIAEKITNINNLQ